MRSMLKPLTSMVAGGVLGFIFLAAGAAVTGARPSHTDPNPDATAAAGATQILPMVAEVHAQEAPEATMPGGMAMGQEMMSGGMAKGKEMMSGGMMAQHQEITKLIDYIVNNFAAIQNETNPVALKTKLAEHGALLKQLQSKSQESARMMEQMGGKMTTCPMMDSMTGGKMGGESSK